MASIAKLSGGRKRVDWRVAQKHYLQIHEDDYDKASGKAMHFAQKLTDAHENAHQRKTNKPLDNKGILQSHAKPCASNQVLMGRAGFEPATYRL